MSSWRTLALVLCALAVLGVHVRSAAEEDEGGYPLGYYGVAPYARARHVPVVVGIGGGHAAIQAAQQRKAANAYNKKKALRSIASRNHNRGAVENRKLASDNLQARKVLAKDLAIASDQGYHRKKRTTIFKSDTLEEEKRWGRKRLAARLRALALLGRRKKLAAARDAKYDKGDALHANKALHAGYGRGAYVNTLARKVGPPAHAGYGYAH